MKQLFLLAALLPAIMVFSQSPDEQAVRKMLSEQVRDWNNGHIEAFMKGYWNSDSLMFIGKSGVTYGWKNTLNNYRKNYPDKSSMGLLRFTLVKVDKLSAASFFVVGKWELERSAGNLNGHFTLLLRKIRGEWVIVADHSS